MSTPQELTDLMADWMIEHGPDRHCDGHEEIARLAWEWMQAQPREPYTTGESAATTPPETLERILRHRAWKLETPETALGAQAFHVAADIAAEHERRWQEDRARHKAQRERLEALAANLCKQGALFFNAGDKKSSSVIGDVTELLNQILRETAED